MDVLVEIVKITLPAGLVLYGMYLITKSNVERELEKARLQVRSKSIETVLPNRLHAYERIALFLERISPSNLVVRLNNGQYTAQEFQQILLNEIRNEYNHNVSQQVYMSEELWDLVKTAKEDLILSINDAAAGMKEKATSIDLSRVILDKFMAKDVDPMAFALIQLKKEISQTY